jgi:hypothetical protein
MPVLERWLQQSENFFFKLQAANVASRIGESARPLLAVLKGMLGSGDAPRAVGRTEQYGLDIVEKTVAVLEGGGAGLVYPAPGR